MNSRTASLARYEALPAARAQRACSPVSGKTFLMHKLNRPKYKITLDQTGASKVYTLQHSSEQREKISHLIIPTGRLTIDADQESSECKLVQ